MIFLKCFSAVEKQILKNLVNICFNPIGQVKKRYAFYGKLKVHHVTKEKRANQRIPVCSRR